MAPASDAPCEKCGLANNLGHHSGRFASGQPFFETAAGEEQLMMISIYRERILLENAFGWKLKTEKYWRNDQETYPWIHFGESGVTLATSEAGATEPVVGSFEALVPCNIPEIAEHVANVNFDLISHYGWSAALNEGVILGIAEMFATEPEEMGEL